MIDILGTLGMEKKNVLKSLDSLINSDKFRFEIVDINILSKNLSLENLFPDNCLVNKIRSNT